MTYNIQFTPKAAKQFSKLDVPLKKRINTFLTRLETTENPRSLGKALQGELSETWSYRIGDYRLLTIIKDNILTITVVHLAHRSTVYK